jgi:hypothetical protein
MHAGSLILAAALFAAPGLFAQQIDIKLDHLIPLAKEHAVVDMSGDQLKAAFEAAAKEGKTKDLKEKFGGIQSLKVIALEFEKPGAYAQSDLDKIRVQLRSPEWSRIVSVKEKDESVDVYMLMRDGKSAGFTMLVAEPAELVVVHILGSLNINDLQAVVDSRITYDLAVLQQKEAAAKK